jgi:hypothetical protein
MTRKKEAVCLHITKPLMARARGLSRVSGVSLSRLAEFGLAVQLDRLDLVLANLPKCDSLLTGDDGDLSGTGSPDFLIFQSKPECPA